MVKDDNAPVTRKHLKKELQTFKGELKNEFATKQDLRHQKEEILEEIKRYFDVTVEDIRHDLLGINHDEIEVIKDRVTRLEQHAGLAA